MRIISNLRNAGFVSLLVLCTFYFNSIVHAGDAIDEEKINTYASAFWNSFNQDLSSGELETYLEHWADNAERITPSRHDKGKAAIRVTYRNYLNTYDDFHQEELRRVTEGNTVVSELLTRARHKVTGDLLSLPNVAILEFNEEGKVRRARVYLDTRKFNP